MALADRVLDLFRKGADFATVFRAQGHVQHAELVGHQPGDRQFRRKHVYTVEPLTGGKIGGEGKAFVLSCH